MSSKRVLFVCLGNACRSQMAEGFARKYGTDVMIADSAGLAPASAIPLLTHQVMKEKNITLDEHFPKAIGEMAHKYDLIVNMSGRKLTKKPAVAVEEWMIRDPYGESDEVYRKVRDEIENLVMRLILMMRTQGSARSKPSGIDFSRGRSRQ